MVYAYSPHSCGLVLICFLKSTFYSRVLAKPTLLFIQIILYCMTYSIHYYNQPKQASCIEFVEVICLNPIGPSRQSHAHP